MSEGGQDATGVLRIGVDVREWRRGTSTGIARVLSGFLEWAAAATPHRLALFGNQFTEMRVAGPRIEPHLVRETNRLLWDHGALPRHLRRAQIEVFLSPYYKGPLRAPCPVVVTANDLIDLHFPRGGPLRRLLLPSWVRIMLRNAAHVLTLSEHARRDIVDTLGIDAARVTAFPPAVDARFLQGVDAAELQRVQARYSLPLRYVLYVGRCAPHKNVATLAAAWSMLPAGLRDGCRLVLAGADVDAFRATAAAHGIDADLPGFIPDGDLPGLYAGATVFCFPSLYEGFGLPPLEAMACGTPVVASAASAIPEVVGDAARLVDARDRGAWAQALRDLLHDAEARSQLAAKGTARARTYTRERSGAAILDCLLQAAGGPAP